MTDDNIISAAVVPPVAAKATKYTEQDFAKVEQVTRWLHAQKLPRAWLGKKTNIPGATMSQILSGKYASSPTAQLDAMLQVLQVESERLKDGPPGYVKGSVHALMNVVFDRTRKHANFGVVTGYVGVGKTRFGKEYTATHPMTIMVEASPAMTPGVLLTELLEQLNCPVPPGLDRKFRDLVRVLSGTTYLVIVDEAEKVNSVAMEYLRRLRDKAGIGVVLTGTEKLTALIQVQHGQFDQIRSRVGMWPDTIESITRDDADEIVRAAMADADVPDDVLDTLWAYSAGSARVLTENLVPALRDYGEGKPLSAALVKAIAAKVLFMKAPGASQ